jgi:hypothetical protein
MWAATGRIRHTWTSGGYKAACVRGCRNYNFQGGHFLGGQPKNNMPRRTELNPLEPVC